MSAWTDEDICRIGRLYCGSPRRPNEGVDSRACLTKSKSLPLSYVWTIGDFRSYVKSDQFILSSIFDGKTGYNFESFQLKVWPKSTTHQYEIVKVAIIFRSRREFKFNVKFSIINEQDDEIEMFRQENITFDEKEASTQVVTYELVRRDTLFDETKGLIVDDQLTILCQIDVFETKCWSSKLTELNWDIPLSRLADDLGHLYESKEMSDLTIHVNGTDLRAHKIILAARCPVFKKMFNVDMKENNLNRVEVLDVEPEVFDEMLRFIYTGRSSLEEVKGEKSDKIAADKTVNESTAPTVEDQNKNKEQEDHHQVEEITATNKQHLAAELLKACEKYQLDRLKWICQKALYESVTADSVAEIIILADLYNATLLKWRAIRFANVNIDKVVKTDGWKRLAQQKPNLLSEILDYHVSWLATSRGNMEKNAEEKKEQPPLLRQP